jgi:phosphoribosylformylglycinamidine synthase subunit PurQ / glutaminase
VAPGNCVFLNGIAEIELPVAHGEGKFVTRNDTVFHQLEKAGQLVLKYKGLGAMDWELEKTAVAHTELPVVSPQSLVPYPDNPNGARGDVAGMCDTTGRVLGLMPHPERFVDVSQHPRWTRSSSREAGDGLRIFQNAVRYFR